LFWSGIPCPGGLQDGPICYNVSPLYDFTQLKHIVSQIQSCSIKASLSIPSSRRGYPKSTPTPFPLHQPPRIAMPPHNLLINPQPNDDSSQPQGAPAQDFFQPCQVRSPSPIRRPLLHPPHPYSSPSPSTSMCSWGLTTPRPPPGRSRNLPQRPPNRQSSSQPANQRSLLLRRPRLSSQPESAGKQTCYRRPYEALYRFPCW